VALGPQIQGSAGSGLWGSLRVSEVASLKVRHRFQTHAAAPVILDEDPARDDLAFAKKLAMDNPDLSAELEVLQKELCDRRGSLPWVDFSGPLQKRDTFQRSRRTVEFRSVCCRGTGIRSEQSSEASSAWWPNLNVALACPCLR
jgi:hypothetical protein